MSISLKEKLAELIFEYDELRFHICPKIEDMYLLSFGFLECEAYNLDIELEMIKRYIELFIRVRIYLKLMKSWILNLKNQLACWKNIWAN